MDTFDSYGGIEAVETLDYELDDRLKECKTSEEKEEAIREYVSLRLISLGIAFVILLVVLAIMGAIYFLIKCTL